jgi:hypothetical protein
MIDLRSDTCSRPAADIHRLEAKPGISEIKRTAGCARAGARTMGTM